LEAARTWRAQLLDGLMNDFARIATWKLKRTGNILRIDGVSAAKELAKVLERTDY
jgi:hypothetical protein